MGSSLGEASPSNRLKIKEGEWGGPLNSDRNTGLHTEHSRPVTLLTLQCTMYHISYIYPNVYKQGFRDGVFGAFGGLLRVRSPTGSNKSNKGIQFLLNVFVSYIRVRVACASFESCAFELCIYYSVTLVNACCTHVLAHLTASY